MKDADLSFEDNPSYLLAKYVSNNDENVLSDVELFLRSKSKYRKKHQDNLEDHGYDGAFADNFDLTFVLVEALKLNNKAVVVDWKEDPTETLDLVNIMSKNKLSQCNEFNLIKQRYQQSDFNISHFLEIDFSEPSIFTCSRNIGENLIIIDNGTDSFVLTLIQNENSLNVTHYAKLSGVNIKLSKVGM